MHYARWRKTGDVGPAEAQKGPRAICKYEGCVSPVAMRRKCMEHLAAEKLAARKACAPGTPPMQRLEFIGWTVTERGCWEWNGARNSNGYGNLGLGGGRTGAAHRVSYEVHHGPIPDGMFVRHKCDNPPCINPDHLLIGTPRQNSGDMVKRRRTRSYASGRFGDMCANGLHQINSQDDLVQGSRNSQMCRECYRETIARNIARRRERRLKNRAA